MATDELLESCMDKISACQSAHIAKVLHESEPSESGKKYDGHKKLRHAQCPSTVVVYGEILQVGTPLHNFP